MSFLGLFNYEKAGKGIAKDAPKKKPFFAFLDLYFRKFWKLIELNFITFLFCLPIVTIGPAIAGMTRVLRNYTIEKGTFLFHEFWRGFKENLKQSIPVGLLDILLVLSISTAVQVYPSMAENSENLGILFYALCAISISFAFTLVMMNFYIYPMIVATDLSLKNIIKNSFFLVCIQLKKNIITLLIVILTVFLLGIGIYLNIATVLLIPLWAISFIGFVVVFNSYPIIQKYVIDPYYEEKGENNPEYNYTGTTDNSVSIFTDKGGNEAPIEPKSKKGKTIS